MDKLKTTILCLATILLNLLAVSCGDNTQQENSPSAELVAVMTTMIIEEVVNWPVICQGVVHPFHQERLSFTAGGIVALISYFTGKRFKRGDKLAVLDESHLTKNWVETGLKFMDVRARLTRLEIELNNGQVNQAAYDDLKREFELRRNLYFHAKSALKNRWLIAPCDGKIAAWYVIEGDSVTGGQTVALLEDMDPEAIARIELNDREYFHLEVGDSAIVISREKSALPLHGTVISKRLAADNERLPFSADVAFENPGGTIPIGAEVSVTISGDNRRKTVLIPQDAIVERQGNSGAVFLTSAKDKFAVRRHVQFGPEIGDKIIVEKGLHRGDHLIIHGQHRLKQGSPIMIIPRDPEFIFN